MFINSTHKLSLLFKRMLRLLLLTDTELDLLPQDGFAPPEDEEIDEGKQGDQEEF